MFDQIMKMGKKLKKKKGKKKKKKVFKVIFAYDFFISYLQKFFFIFRNKLMSNLIKKLYFKIKFFK